MNPNYLTRQFDLIPARCLGQKISVVGAGGIGSWLILSLAKMGFGNITVFDFDTISEENMNNQFYPPKDIGKPKVEALRELVGLFTGVDLTVHNEPWVPGKTLPGILITAVDSMDVRKSLWDTHKKAFGTDLVIDPRMGAEIARLFTAKPHEEESSYEKSLTSDAESAEEPCTAKATIYTANLIAGLVVKTVKDFVTSNPYYKSLNWNIPNGEMEYTTSDGKFLVTQNPKGA